MLVFLDTEFTDLLRPQLLSLGLVTSDLAHEHYTELDLSTDVGKARQKAAGDFASFEVLDQWGAVAAAKATEWEMGRSAGEWLVARAAEAGGRVEVAYDYAADMELLEAVIREARLWEQVGPVIMPVNVDQLTGTIDGELAAEECFREMKKRGLRRHHALADAHALAHAYRAVKDTNVRFARFAASEQFHMLAQATELGAALKCLDGFDTSRWLWGWLVSDVEALDRRRPLDVIDGPDGADHFSDIVGDLVRGRYQR